MSLMAHFATAEEELAFPYTEHEEHADQRVHLRFGDWPADERSNNHITGHKECGVSVYDLNKHGDPANPDPDWNRAHEHESHCEPDCDLDSWNDDYGNDSGEEMKDRARHARSDGNVHNAYRAHLVKGTFVGIGHDGEPLLQNVRKVGHWPCDITKHIPGAHAGGIIGTDRDWCRHPDHDEDR